MNYVTQNDQSLISLMLAVIFLFFLCNQSLFFMIPYKHTVRKILTGRSRKIRRLDRVAQRVVTDVLAALKDEDEWHGQASAMLPLLLDIRKAGEQLLHHQRFYHFWLQPENEKKLKRVLARLTKIERLLRSLPKRDPAELFSQ